MSEKYPAFPSKVEQNPRIKTNSEPASKLDRFIPPRKTNQELLRSPSFFRINQKYPSSPLQNDEFDSILKLEFFYFRNSAQERNKISLEPLFEESSLNLSSYYCKSKSSLYSFQSSENRYNVLFKLPKSPFKILDIPGLEDDYYTNLLSWSVKNQIAICLENKIYAHDYPSGLTNEIYEAFDCESITSLGHSPDGTRLAFGNLLGKVVIHDFEKNIEVSQGQLHSDRIGCLDWNLQGIISGSKDRTAVFWDPRAKPKKTVLICSHLQEICGIKWNNEMNLIATGGNDNKVCIWPFGNGKRLFSGKHNSGVKALAWSEKQYGYLATGGGTNDRFIRVWNTNILSLECERNVEAQVCSIVYSKLTNDIVSGLGSDFNEIKMWRSKNLKLVGSMIGHTDRPLHLALSPDGSILATASPDETLRFWKIFDEKKFLNTELLCFGEQRKLKIESNCFR